MPAVSSLLPLITVESTSLIGGAVTRFVREGEPFTPQRASSQPRSAQLQTVMPFFRPSITCAGVMKRGVFVAGVTVITAGSSVFDVSMPFVKLRRHTIVKLDTVNARDKRKSEEARSHRACLRSFGI